MTTCLSVSDEISTVGMVNDFGKAASIMTPSVSIAIPSRKMNDEIIRMTCLASIEHTSP